MIEVDRPAGREPSDEDHMTDTKPVIKLHNTKTRQKEVFTPIDAENVRMYVCGPTVYDRAHLGNARPVVVFDVLNRLLRHVYGDEYVKYVRNFTDVDDKINARAAESGRSIGEITDETIQWFLDDMGALGALEPDHMPRATQFIPQMVSMIKSLIDKGFAYSKPISYGHNSRAVYFNAEKAPEHAFFRVDKDDGYGQLSGRSLDEMIAGSRAELGEGKENPMDFVLWKPSNIDEPGWESPWGLGRPGWHIECSAMAKALLGDTFDIHGGGLDLQFPHHENEIAQSCCANDTDEMARYWLHNEMLQVEGKKMSKSLGNFFTVHDLLEQGVPGEVIRFVFLSTHYRKPMDWTEKRAKEAEATLRKWRLLTQNIEPAEEIDELMLHRLADDLNTPHAITELHRLAQGVDFEGDDLAVLKASAQLLGLLTDDLGGWVNPVSNVSERIDRLVEGLMSERFQAREHKLFERADAIRDGLKNAGVIVKDEGNSYSYEFSSDFDPAKLEALK